MIPALVFVLACSVVDPERPDLSISLRSDIELPPSHTFRVVVAGRTHDLELGSRPDTLYTTDRRAPRTGELAVTASLLNAGRTAVATASFAQRYESGSNHWVAAWVGAQRPIGHCCGTLVPVLIEPPLSGSRTDSLFVMHGSLPEGAVC